MINFIKRKKAISSILVLSITIIFLLANTNAFQIQNEAYIIKGALSEKVNTIGNGTDYRIRFVNLPSNCKLNVDGNECVLQSRSYNIFLDAIMQGAQLDGDLYESICRGEPYFGDWLDDVLFKHNQCCGDDLDDAGYMTPEGIFACFDNSLQETDLSGKITTVVSPFYDNSFHAWRNAYDFPGIIMRTTNNFYVSNLESWYYCDIHDSTPARAIGELDTIPSSTLSLEPYCSVIISQILGEEGSVINCAIHDGGSQVACESEVRTKGLSGYCPSFAPGIYPKYNVSNGAFFTDCNPCLLLDENDEFYGNLQLAYNNPESSFNSNFCDHPFFKSLEICGFGGSSGQGTSGLMDSLFCKQNPELCLGVPFSTTDSCADIHGAFGYEYTNDAEKLCDLSTDYCYEGFLTDSNDASGTCCVGPNSYCTPFAGLSCSAIGGERFFSQQGEFCAGNIIELDEGSCCLGTVRADHSLLMPGLVKGEAFICYAHHDKSFISECCGPMGCINKNNDLNRNEDVISTTYAMTGASYHMISSFDSEGFGMNVLTQSFSNNNPGFFSVKQVALQGGQLFPSFRNNFNVEGFNTIEFDLLTNNMVVIENFILIDESDNEWIFDLSNNLKGNNFRWQKVQINLINPPSAFNKQDVKDIKFTFSQQAQLSIAIDRIFLSNPSSTINSQNMFCTGDWGEWVSNKDGPTDMGFFGPLGQPRADGLDIYEYGPYKEACDGTMTSTWTGSACCGDDEGEYWIDRGGICWNSTAVLHDNTVANAITPNYGLQPIKEKSLMFYGGQAWVCASEISDYTEQFSFSQTNQIPTLLKDRIPADNKVTPFTVKGRWMCQPGEGWVGIDKVNRLTLLASYLLEEANQENPNMFTLHCGDMENVVNLDSLDSGLLGAFCMLRTGSNRDFIEVENGVPLGEVYLAFESKNLTVNLLDKLNESILVSFDALHDAQIDCSGTPTNPTGAEFFSSCVLDSDYFDGTIYYNKPFKLVLISSKAPQQTSFLAGMWENLVDFFKRIFGGGNQQVPQSYVLSNFSQFDKSNELYISVQGNRQIVGKSEITGINANAKQKIRVDYTNLSTNVSFLADVLNNKQPNSAVWSPQGNSQIIFSFIQGKTNFLTFNDVTSLLRLINTSSTPGNFGYHENCTITDKTGATENVYSGEQMPMYEEEESLTCNDDSHLVKCYNGQTLDKNNQPINPNQYYFECEPPESYSLTITHTSTPNLRTIPARASYPVAGITSGLYYGYIVPISVSSSLLPQGVIFKEWRLNGNVIDPSTNNITITNNAQLEIRFVCDANAGCNTGYECDNGSCMYVEEGEIPCPENPICLEGEVLNHTGSFVGGCPIFECVEEEGDAPVDVVWEYYEEEFQLDANYCNNWHIGQTCDYGVQEGVVCTPYAECVISATYHGTPQGDDLCVVTGYVCQN